ncbi:MAG: hypothetical protein Phyf2KO_24080 [Phycisphaerales bacterium]
MRQTLASGIGLGLTVSACAFGQPVDYQVVAATGQSAFGMPAGYTYRGFGLPMLDDAGRVTLLATYNDETGGNAGVSALIRFGAGEPEFLLQYGDAPIGVDPGQVFVALEESRINRNGLVTIEAHIDDLQSGSHDWNGGIYALTEAGPFQKVVLAGEIAAGTDSYFRLDELYRFDYGLSTDGHIAFESDLYSQTGHDRGSGIWVWDPATSALTLVVREDDDVPGMQNGVHFQWLATPRVSANGVVVFYAIIDGQGISNANDAAWFRWDEDSGLSQIIREGDPVPGFPPTVTFSSVAARVNDLGHTLIWGDIEGPGITDDSDQILISDRGGNGYEHVYREGIQAPTLTPGVKVSNIGDVFFNNQSHIGFFSRVDGPVATGEEGRYFWAEGILPGLAKVTRTGQHVPGFSDEFTLGSYEMTYSSESHGPPPAFSDTSRFSFFGGLSGPNPNPLDPIASAFITDSVGELRLLAPTGAQLDISSDPQNPMLRTVESRRFDIPSSANADDDIAMLVRFTDDSSAIVVATYANGCLADVNGDGIATPTDFTAWLDAFNSGSPACDQNGDGQCTPTDFTAWLSNYSLGC